MKRIIFLFLIMLPFANALIEKVNVQYPSQYIINTTNNQSLKGIDVNESKLINLITLNAPNMSNYLPYTGATKNIDLGIRSIYGASISSGTTIVSYDKYTTGQNYVASFDSVNLSDLLTGTHYGTYFTPTTIWITKMLDGSPQEASFLIIPDYSKNILSFSRYDSSEFNLTIGSSPMLKISGRSICFDDGSCQSTAATTTDLSNYPNRTEVNSTIDSKLLGSTWFFNSNFTQYGTTAGQLSNTWNYDNYDAVSYNLSDVVVNGMTWYANTSANVSSQVNRICIRYKSNSENYDLGIYDLGGYYENYLSLAPVSMFNWACADIRDASSHLISNKISIKISHTGQALTNHKLEIDALYVSSGYTPRIGNEVDPLSIHVNTNTITNANITVNGNLNVTNTIFTNSINFSGRTIYSDGTYIII